MLAQPTAETQRSDDIRPTAVSLCCIHGSDANDEIAHIIWVCSILRVTAGIRAVLHLNEGMSGRDTAERFGMCTSSLALGG